MNEWLEWKGIKDYFSHFMRYAFDKGHSFDAEMENLTKGNNSVNKLLIMCTAHLLDAPCKCMKFHCNIFSSSLDMPSTKILIKGNNSAKKNVSVVKHAHFSSMLSISVWSLIAIPSILYKICFGQNYLSLKLEIWKRGISKKELWTICTAQLLHSFYQCMKFHCNTFSS